jgi:hypothetical protein
VGKSHLLRQLENDESFKAFRIDFRDLSDKGVSGDELIAKFSEIFETDAELILLDEICCVPNYDALLGSIDKEIGRVKKKIVITGTAYETLSRLAFGRLGARSNVLEMFPLSFEEYLHFTDKIGNYGDEYMPSKKDLFDFYRMKDLPPDMDLLIDATYMDGVFREMSDAKNRSNFGKTALSLTREQYIAVADILAYSLNYTKSAARFLNDESIKVGAQEYGSKMIRMRGWGRLFSQSIVEFARNRVNLMSPGEIATVIAYMLSAGFLFVDLTISPTGKDCPDNIAADFLTIKSLSDLEAVLGKYTVSVISPLLYTRLMVELESLTGVEAEEIYGELYELAVKSEDVCRRGFAPVHYSYKYNESANIFNTANAVDLVAFEDMETATEPYKPRKLLLEVTTGRKVAVDTDKNSRTDHNLRKVYKEIEFIRVVTDREIPYEKRDYLHVIYYPLALLKLSNGSIFTLECSKL